MGNSRDKELLFITPSMAEILLSQNLLEAATQVIEELKRTHPDDPRVTSLETRLVEMRSSPMVEQSAGAPAGRDQVSLEWIDQLLRANYETSETGLAIARRKARYSGHTVIRLFTAAPGPRGVRVGSRDKELSHLAGRIDFTGLPRPAVHVAAVGFLSNSGEFVPLAQSEPLSIGR